MTSVFNLFFLAVVAGVVSAAAAYSEHLRQVRVSVR